MELKIFKDLRYEDFFDLERDIRVFKLYKLWDCRYVFINGRVFFCYVGDVRFVF